MRPRPSVPILHSSARSRLESQAFVDSIKFPPEMEKDLRRHWKKKPDVLEVVNDGKITKVKTSWVLTRIKEREQDRKKWMDSLPVSSAISLARTREVIPYIAPSASFPRHYDPRQASTFHRFVHARGHCWLQAPYFS